MEEPGCFNGVRMEGWDGDDGDVERRDGEKRGDGDEGGMTKVMMTEGL